MVKYQVSDDQCSVTEKAMNPWANITDLKIHSGISDVMSQKSGKIENANQDKSLFLPFAAIGYGDHREIYQEFMHIYLYFFEQQIKYLEQSHQNTSQS